MSVFSRMKIVIGFGRISASRCGNVICSKRRQSSLIFRICFFGILHLNQRGKLTINNHRVDGFCHQIPIVGIISDFNQPVIAAGIQNFNGRCSARRMRPHEACRNKRGSTVTVAFIQVNFIRNPVLCGALIVHIAITELEICYITVFVQIGNLQRNRFRITIIIGNAVLPKLTDVHSVRIGRNGIYSANCISVLRIVSVFIRLFASIDPGDFAVFNRVCIKGIGSVSIIFNVFIKSLGFDFAILNSPIFKVCNEVISSLTGIYIESNDVINAVQQSANSAQIPYNCSFRIIQMCCRGRFIIKSIRLRPLVLKIVPASTGGNDFTINRNISAAPAYGRAVSSNGIYDLIT